MVGDRWGARNAALIKVLKCLHSHDEMTATHGVEGDRPIVGGRLCKALQRLQKFFHQYKLVTSKIWVMDDETTIKIMKEWRDLYRVVDKDGNTVDFLAWGRRHLERLITKVTHRNSHLE